MKQYISLYCLAIVLLASCGGERETFVIKGTINNLGGQSLYAFYENGHTVSLDTLRPDDGRIAMSGQAEELTPVQIYDVAMRPFMRLYMKTGDEIEITGDALKPYEIEMEGNALNRELWELICNNSEIFDNVQTERINARHTWQRSIHLQRAEARLDSLLIDYISSHSGAQLSSILIGDYLLRADNYPLCDSLWQTLDADARIPYIARTMQRIGEERAITDENRRLPHLRFLDVNDSIFFVNPRRSKATLLYIWAAQDPLSAQYRNELAQYTRCYKKDDVQVVALSVDRDTAVWHRAVENDSLPIFHMWCECPYNNRIMQRYHIDNNLPIVMLGDSVGTILVRTRQLPDADVDAQLDSLVNIRRYAIEKPIIKP